MKKKNGLVIVVSILLLISLSYNAFQYNEINHYKATMNSIDSDARIWTYHTGNFLKDHELEESDLKFFASRTGFLESLSRWSSSYEDDLDKLTDSFTYLNNVFISSDLELINKYRLELSDALIDLYEKPMDASVRERFINLVMRMQDESMKR
ncbi:MAG: hypothetical protein K0R84_2463 [Clostridia bacterium]|jgi:hypothetical protein|nr:hypothetical protein [Clostridia bacterium]